MAGVLRQQPVDHALHIRALAIAEKNIVHPAVETAKTQIRPDAELP